MKVLKWNIPTVRVQIVEVRNGIIYLVIMFTPRVTAFKISEVANVFLFSADSRKKLDTVWAIYLNTPGWSYRIFPENGMGIMGLMSIGLNCLWHFMGRSIKK